MAEALVNVLLDRLASITHNKVEREIELVIGVDKEVTNLTSNLEAIRGVLEDAEQRQVKDANVRHWLNNLKQVSYEMDNVLDEWITEILKLQIEKGDKEGENALATKKVCLPIPSLCNCFGKVNQVIHRRDIALKIENLNERLTVIANERQRYNFQYTERLGEQLVRQKTSSLVDISFGRQNETNSLVSKLVSESSQDGRGPLIIPIVGMGGIGKTTLSQLAYNHEMVKTHFDLRIWVCVSDPFDEIKIAKAIVEGLTENVPNSNELQTLVQCICKLIQGKKFLLVLDDVWNPKLSQWEQLNKPLRSGDLGSRILVTTRKEEVANMLGATTHMIHLEGLSEEYCRSLFYHIAFIDRKRNNESKMFEAVGNDIVKKCKGLPLAAKTLGSLMRGKCKLKEWKDVLNSKIWELKGFEQEVFQPLLLSYYDLTPTIRRCLLYCVIFPKDYVIDKDDLIKLWMSQDYLNVEGNHEEKDMGQTYLYDLAMRSFFQDFKKDDDGNIISCKMHDIVHDFVQYLTKKESFIMEIKGAYERVERPDDKILHLTLMFAFGCALPISFCNFKNLRTLTAFDSQITTIGSDLILQLKCLRTLNLSCNYIEEIPKEIGKLIHLRYLDLSKNKHLKVLPNALGELYNLQTLQINGCSSLINIPNMGRLINLKHLHVEGTWSPKIEGIGRLRNLQMVDELHVNGGTERPKLEDLKNMDHLRHLAIRNIGSAEDASEGEKAQLVNKKELLHLELDFECGCGCNRKHGKNNGEILNSLQPHPGLESLVIKRCYNTRSSPNWLLSLQNLRKLYFSIPYCMFSPPFGKLLSLESLEISRSGMRKIGVDFLGIDMQTSLISSSSSHILFPKLKQLKFIDMDSWEEWKGVEGWREEDSDQITIMPCLSTLEFNYCRMLRALPNFLRKTPLQMLWIIHCPFLAPVYKKGRGSEWAKISHTLNIQIDSEKVQKDGVWIQDDHGIKDDDETEDGVY